MAHWKQSVTTTHTPLARYWTIALSSFMCLVWGKALHLRRPRAYDPATQRSSSRLWLKFANGVPSYLGDKDGLVLGDVMISDGIVQYDFGRQFPDIVLGKARQVVPGPKLRGLLAKLKGVRGRERLETKLSRHLRVLQDRLSHERAGYPGIEKDELSRSTYRHRYQDPAACTSCRNFVRGVDPVCEHARVLTCQELGCQKGPFVRRTRLQEAAANGCPPRSRIHFGLVGSGDPVMKSGQHRHKFATHSIVSSLLRWRLPGFGIFCHVLLSKVCAIIPTAIE